MRSVAVAVLLALGALFAFSANATVWVNRTVFHEDQFVSTAHRTINDPEVQQQLSVRLSDAIVERGDLETRIREALPQELRLLAVPLTQTTREVVQRQTLRFLQSDAADAAIETALRQVHTRVIGLIEDRSTNVQFQGDSIVLDLHAILLQVAQQFGVSDPDGLLARVDLPPDAGQIVLVEDAGYIKTGADIAQRHQTITNATAIATIVTFLLAILVSRSRRATVRTVGYVLIAVGVIASVILFPIRSIAASFAQNPSAAKAAFNELVLNYREQAFVMMLIGLLIAGVAALFGQTALARAVRSGGRGPGVQAELREAAPALRIGALAVGALVLIAWPDPSRRVYVTAFFLLAVFLAVLWIITTESEWGTSLRERTERAWSRITAEGDTQGSHRWFAGHAGQLRVLGILVTIAAILFWPSLTFAGFAALVAAGLLYLAAVEWLATRPASAHQ